MKSNQDWVLARFREAASKEDPAPYSVEQRHGRPMVWMSVAGNPGWYAPYLKGSELIHLIQEWLPQDPGFYCNRRKDVFNHLKYLGKAQRARVVEAMVAYRKSSDSGAGFGTPNDYHLK